jgi:hypothetical protein
LIGLHLVISSKWVRCCRHDPIVAILNGRSWKFLYGRKTECGWRFLLYFLILFFLVNKFKPIT